MEGDGSTTSSMNALTTKDPGWKYFVQEKPNNKNDLICNFCTRVIKGGICRAKQHLVGGFRNSRICPKCPPNIREEIRQYMKQREKINLERVSNPIFEEVCPLDDSDEDEDGDTPRSSNASVASKRKRDNIRGPMDLFARRSVDPSKVGKKDRQTTLDEATKKILRDKAVASFTRWLYDAGIAFNTVKLSSLQEAFDDIGAYGVGCRKPSYHEARVPYLKKAIAHVDEGYVSICKADWVKYGCSLMVDGWTDRRQRTLLNFLVNSPKGSVFIESVDASNYAKTGDKLFQLINAFVERVGEENVVQIITDNASNMVAAGKLLEARRPHLYWTPCAAHCIDLMLEDIGKEPKIKECFKKAMKVTSYIYTRTGLVNMLRKFTGQRELSRAGITRFATCYLNLEKLHMLRENLRTMFTSEDWTESKWSKEVESKKVVSTILSVSFWRNVQYTLKIYAPLVSVLRLVDGERRPPMGYIYEAMDRAKESIISAFNGKEEKYKKAFEIIDNRWNCQLHRPLHAAGYLLNPRFFYAHEGSLDEEVMEGFFGAVERLVPSKDDQNQISIQLSKYRNAEGSFSREMAIRQRQTIYPSLWWENFGSSTPQLQKFAIRVLSLTCSSSGCERNWSVFEHIHSKRRSSTDHDKLRDLVFVKYNRALQRRYNERDETDPITLKDIDDSNEWLTGRMVDDSDEEPEENDIVFQGESLTWGQVSRAIGADEPAYLTREKGGKSTVPSSSSSSSRLPSKQVNKGKGKVDDAGKSKGNEKANMNKGKNVRSLLRLVDEDDEYECEGEGSEEEQEDFREKNIRFYDYDDDDDDELDGGDD